jgi:hypothetical protein
MVADRYPIVTPRRAIWSIDKQFRWFSNLYPLLYGQRNGSFGLSDLTSRLSRRMFSFLAAAALPL